MDHDGRAVWWEDHCRPSVGVVEIEVGDCFVFCQVTVSPCSLSVGEKGVGVDDSRFGGCW